MKDICAFIEEYQFEYKRTPTMDEFDAEVGTVKSNVFKYLSEMEQCGMIRRYKREIEIPSAVQTITEMNRVPILGRIACGEPEFTEENFEAYVPLPVALFGKGDFFILHAKGYSMIEAGMSS